MASQYPFMQEPVKLQTGLQRTAAKCKKVLKFIHNLNKKLMSDLLSTIPKNNNSPMKYIFILKITKKNKLRFKVSLFKYDISRMICGSYSENC